MFLPALASLTVNGSASELSTMVWLLVPQPASIDIGELAMTSVVFCWLGEDTVYDIQHLAC